MSTPTGQSLEQPLQDRHRSSASAISGARQPTYQRPVRQLLQHPGAAPGGVLLVPGGQERRAHHAAGGGGVRPALADAHAAVHGGGEVAARRRGRRSRGRGGAAAPAGTRRSASSGAGSTITPGLSRLAGSKSRFTAPNSPIASARVHRREQFAAGPPVAVLAGRRPAVGGGQPGRVLHERAQHAGRSRSGKSIRTCTQPSPKCPYIRPSTPCAGHQGRQLPQVGRAACPAARRESSQPGQAGAPPGCGRRGPRRPRGCATARRPGRR